LSDRKELPDKLLEIKEFDESPMLAEFEMERVKEEAAVSD